VTIAPGDLESRPPVSVIMVVRNEERHLRASVERVLAQDYPAAIECVIAVGPSADRTDEVAAALAAADRRVTVVANPTGRTATGLNAALAACSPYPVVVRVDGHALLREGYIRRAVEVLHETGADNVGGIMAAEGESPFECAVARAMTSPIGVGNARFHNGGAPGPVDTVYLGVFRRSVLEAVGGYDERFTRAQDYELNVRIREAGGVVWFTPDLQVTYRPRSTVRGLSRQYFEYGRWRWILTRQHPRSLRPRYLAAPVAVVGIVAGTAAGAAGWRPGWAAPAGYVALLLGGSALVGRSLPRRALLRLPVALATMHLAWGAGFLTSMVRPADRASAADAAAGLAMPST
jgi:glycosyltransferase involved in cell wall biosynthesis